VRGSEETKAKERDLDTKKRRKEERHNVRGEDRLMGTWGEEYSCPDDRSLSKKPRIVKNEKEKYRSKKKPRGGENNKPYRKTTGGLSVAWGA